MLLQIILMTSTFFFPLLVWVKVATFCENLNRVSSFAFFLVAASALAATIHGATTQWESAAAVDSWLAEHAVEARLIGELAERKRQAICFICGAPAEWVLREPAAARSSKPRASGDQPPVVCRTCGKHRSWLEEIHIAGARAVGDLPRPEARVRLAERFMKIYRGGLSYEELGQIARSDLIGILFTPKSASDPVRLEGTRALASVLTGGSGALFFVSLTLLKTTLRKSVKPICRRSARE